MKAPKNFYNTVDQTKLGIDDLFTRTAENEEDIAALENVVGDDTSGLVKSVSDLEDVVGDLDEGLVKDVHDLQDDSERYHDDIADLKSADITLGLRIDDVIDDVDDLKTQVTESDEAIANIQKTLDEYFNPPSQLLHEFDFTESLVDKVGGQIEFVLSGNDISRSSDGITISGGNGYAQAPDMLAVGRTIEIGFGSNAIVNNNILASLFSYQGREYYGQLTAFGFHQTTFGIYNYQGNYKVDEGVILVPDAPLSLLNNGTLKIKIVDSNKFDVFINNQFVHTVTANAITQSFARLGNGGTIISPYTTIYKSFKVWG